MKWIPDPSHSLYRRNEKKKSLEKINLKTNIEKWKKEFTQYHGLNNDLNLSLRLHLEELKGRLVECKRLRTRKMSFWMEANLNPKGWSRKEKPVPSNSKLWQTLPSQSSSLSVDSDVSIFINYYLGSAWEVDFRKILKIGRIIYKLTPAERKAVQKWIKLLEFPSEEINIYKFDMKCHHLHLKMTICP